jgi:beta-galactosidase
MLTTSGNQFLLDGAPFRILSGAIHYFRVLPGSWRDRLEKALAFGLNTVETYVAWNLHEPRPGEFRFDGMLDLARFIDTAGELGLKVIVRPGPYICSEWDFGGLPAWLLKDPAMQVRCSHPPYLAAVDRFFDALLPRLAPRLASHGGPVIAMQVENEYGSYGNDKAYLQFLADGLRRRGADCLLFTSDGPRDGTLQSGTLPDLLKTVNFAYGAVSALTRLRQYQPEGPQMVTEFWSGWFDHWGEEHHLSAGGLPTSRLSQFTLDQILASGASVNFYMFHGGTNFGFMNGANTDHERYQADVTSYDYDAPLDEAGDPGRKFASYGRILRRYVPGLPALILPPAGKKMKLAPLHATASASLFDSLSALGKFQPRPAPEPMEAFDQSYGFILYRTHVPGARNRARLRIHGLHDRAQVFQDGKPAGVLEREFPLRTLRLSIPPAGARLDLLVENMGRVNYGPQLIDRKGILNGVSLDDQFLYDWEILPLPLEDLSQLEFKDRIPTRYPAFFRTAFEVPEPADTFLRLPGWTKGVAWVNGFNLGRYWKRGPQRTLYVPGTLLRPGANELVLLELQNVSDTHIFFQDRPDLT